MVIRTAVDEDLDKIASLCVEALTCDAEDARLLPQLLWDSPTSRPDLKLVAEADEGILGVAFSALHADGDGPPVGFIDLLAVAPTAQGQGHGRGLLAAAEDTLKRGRRGRNAFRRKCALLCMAGDKYRLHSGNEAGGIGRVYAKLRSVQHERGFDSRVPRHRISGEAI